MAISWRCTNCGMVNLLPSQICSRCQNSHTEPPLIKQSPLSVPTRYQLPDIESLRQVIYGNPSQIVIDPSNNQPLPISDSETDSEWTKKAHERFNEVVKIREQEEQRAMALMIEERKAFLMQRFNNKDIVDRIINKKLELGDSEDVVREIFGSPQDIDVTILKTKRREIWKYEKQTKNQYKIKITIENGTIVSMEEKGILQNSPKESLQDNTEDIEVDYEGVDRLYEEAIKVICEMKKASTSVLQRRLGIGYGRAASILDMLEIEGCVGPSDGSKPRQVKPHAYEYLERVAQTAESRVPDPKLFKKIRQRSDKISG